MWHLKELNSNDTEKGCYSPVNSTSISLRISGYSRNIHQHYTNTVYVISTDGMIEETVEDAGEFNPQFHKTINATPRKEIMIPKGDWNTRNGEGASWNYRNIWIG